MKIGITEREKEGPESTIFIANNNISENPGNLKQEKSHIKRITNHNLLNITRQESK